MCTNYVLLPVPVPSKPLNVTAVVRSPERVDVTWRAPKVANGPLGEIQYEILHWEAQKTQEHKVRPMSY